MTAACLLIAGQGRAAERITLRNGFELSCHHHAPAQSGMRLYLSPGTDSYIEVAPGDIASIEAVPDALPDNAPVGPAGAADVAGQNASKGMPLSGSGAAARIVPVDPKLDAADLRQMLAKAGHTHNLDVDLLASVVKAESGGRVRAVSRTGARGLMQLMPGTAADLGVEDSFRADQNVRGGSMYLDALLTRYHDNLALALAAYNAGPAAVDKYHGIPPYRETRLYVARVIHEFNHRVLAREAQARKASSRAALASAVPHAGGS